MSKVNKVDDEKTVKKPDQKKEEEADDESGNESTFQIMKGYLKNETCSMWWGILFLIGGSLSDFMAPIFIGTAVDYMDCGQFYEARITCIYFIITIIFAGAFAGLRARLFNVMSDRIARDLRNEIFSKILICDTAFFDKKENMTGALLSRINADVEVIQGILSTNVSMTLRGGTLIIAIMARMLSINLKLAGITFASLILCISAVGSYGECMKKFQKLIATHKSLMTSDALESFTNIKTVKAFSAEETEIKKFESGNIKVFNVGMKKALWTASFTLVQQIGQYGALAVICYVSYGLYKKDQITVGEITQYIFYTQTLIFQFWMLSFVIGNVLGVQGVNAALAKIRNSVPTIINPDGDRIENDDEINGHLALENVTFSYPEKMDVVALDNVSFEVNNQDKRVIALVGGSGCGKSSCVAMLQQFYLPLQGRVTFNGRDIRTLNSRWYHSQVAIVQQEPILFQDTIRNNIMYGIENRHTHTKDAEGKYTVPKSDAELLELLDEACKQASVYDFIMDTKLFPDGYDTLIGAGGVQLSGGQKQRVAIARALIRKPKVLLLDEATSALDTESEHQVQLALNKLIELGKQTVVIVAHRLSTVKDADEIIVLNKGKIVERGNHESLVTLNGTYKKLVERQLVTMEAEKLDEVDKLERMESMARLTRTFSKKTESKQ